MEGAGARKITEVVLLTRMNKRDRKWGKSYANEAKAIPFADETLNLSCRTLFSNRSNVGAVYRIIA
jgi:hypothetical protein